MVTKHLDLIDCSSDLWSFNSLGAFWDGIYIYIYMYCISSVFMVMDIYGLLRVSRHMYFVLEFPHHLLLIP